MGEIVKNESSFIGYEYKDMTVKRGMESLYTDGYTNFGWMLEGTTVSLQGVGSVIMKFKRDRKIRNKAELTRLQRQFESHVNEIELLEKSKVSRAVVTAFTIGILGTALMAGSVFAYLAGMLPLSVILAIPAFVGWALPYFVYCHLLRQKSLEIAPIIDQKYDEIYEVCEKANGLLN